MPDLKTLQQELDDTRREVLNLTVLAMAPRLSAKEAAAVKEMERSARAEVKLRVKALEYWKRQQPAF
jgi:hypothetical protein